jgi:hypothetical protein
MSPLPRREPMNGHGAAGCLVCSMPIHWRFETLSLFTIQVLEVYSGTLPEFR